MKKRIKKRWILAGLIVIIFVSLKFLPGCGSRDNAPNQDEAVIESEEVASEEGLVIASDERSPCYWTRQINGIGDGMDFANAIAVASNGDSYVGGSFSVGASTGWDNPFGPIVFKFNRCGERIWKQDFTSILPAPVAGRRKSVNGIAVNRGNNSVFVVGEYHVSETEAQIFVARLNARDGAIAWSAIYGGPLRDVGNGITINTSGSHIFVTGYSYKTGDEEIYGEYGNKHLVVLKFVPPSTTPVWVTEYSSTFEALFPLPPPVPGLPSRPRDYDEGKGIVYNNDGRVFVVGSTSTVGASSEWSSGIKSALFVAKINIYSGSIEWTRSYVDSSISPIGAAAVGNGICRSPSGTLHIIGSCIRGTGSNQDMIIQSYNRRGALLSTELVNGRENLHDEGFGIAFVPGRGRIFTGETRMPGVVNSDIYVSVPTGRIEGFERYVDGPIGNIDKGQGIGHDRWGNIYVAGLVTKGSEFGPAGTDWDIWVRKYSPTGEAVP